MTFEQESAKARQRVRQFDSIFGFADRKLETILAALEAGLTTNERELVFHAYAMLKDRVQISTAKNN